MPNLNIKLLKINQIDNTLLNLETEIKDEKKLDSYKKIEINQNEINESKDKFEVVVYAKSNEIFMPKWVSEVGNMFQPYLQNSIYNDLFESKDVAKIKKLNLVIFLKTTVIGRNAEKSDRIFAISFGNNPLMDKFLEDKLEDKFGILTALNIIDSKTISSLQKSEVGNTKKQVREEGKALQFDTSLDFDIDCFNVFKKKRKN